MQHSGFIIIYVLFFNYTKVSYLIFLFADIIQNN